VRAEVAYGWSELGDPELENVDEERRNGDRTMSINIELTAQEIAALKQFTKLDDDAEAVQKATREYLRLNRLRELKAVSRKVEFEASWQELEERELAESDFPQ
jgi:Arc/MetJ family transcription regulator